MQRNCGRLLYGTRSRFLRHLLSLRVAHYYRYHHLVSYQTWGTHVVLFGQV